MVPLSLNPAEVKYCNSYCGHNLIATEINRNISTVFNGFGTCTNAVTKYACAVFDEIIYLCIGTT